MRHKNIPVWSLYKHGHNRCVPVIAPGLSDIDISSCPILTHEVVPFDIQGFNVPTVESCFCQYHMTLGIGIRDAKGKQRK